MGPEVPGQLAVWLALVLNLLAGGAFALAARGRESVRSLANRAYYAFTLITTLAVADLFYLFFSHNYAFKYVYEYSESTQPFFYILSAFWGGQEGTYLLWVFLSALCGFLILRRGGRYRDHAMAFFSLVNLFFLFLLIKASPFALLPAPALDGLGLNPLLRDPWMVIHPPVIFVGYAFTGVPFALAMAALARNDYSDWVRRAFPWVAASAFFLGAGNILGGYWAYKTLGWGGYWAWDPVENSSLVPWIISLGLLHGLIIERRSGALRKTNLLTSAFLFLLVVYGTFLTRSGVLSDFSVHSFADMGINVNLIGFMAFFVLLSLAMFFFRARSIKSAPLDYNYFGKEFSLFASVTVLFLFGLIVLFWSSLPILSGWFSDEPRAAEIATYNDFAVPLSIIMAFLLTVGPLATYGGHRLRPRDPKLIAVVILMIAVPVGWTLLRIIEPVYNLAGTGTEWSDLKDAILSSIFTSATFMVYLATLVVGAILIYLINPAFRKPLIPGLAAFVLTLLIAPLAGVTDYLILLFYATAAMAAVSNLIYLAGYIPDRIKFIGAPLTHFGFGVMLIGVMASSAFDSSERLVIPQGQTAKSEAYNITVGYNGMKHDLDHPNNELLLTLDDGSGPNEIRPELYYSRRMNGVMRQPYISRTLAHDLYLAPQQVVESEQAGGLALQKGEAKQQGDLTFTFQDFEVGGHEEMGAESMSVTARIEVARGDEVQTISPRIVQGGTGLTHEPAEFSLGGQKYQADILQVMADQGVVVLDIPGLLPQLKPARLILDISKKPMISLVWIGTTLILLGSLASVYRRRSELVQTND